MILADTSIWIDYFHDAPISDMIETLLLRGELCVNDVILAEILPSIRHRGEHHLEVLLTALPRLRMMTDWDELIMMQTKNLRHGINKVGLPDLMIVQNAIQHNVRLLSSDKHFSLMNQIFQFDLYFSDTEINFI